MESDCSLRLGTEHVENILQHFLLGAPHLIPLLPFPIADQIICPANTPASGRLTNMSTSDVVLWRHYKYI